jgi:glyoxylase-like metal-dependent hydrolase (beta-lactamase superfamily II)
MTWEALAIRYGTRPARRGEFFYRYETYGEPDAPLQMDYFFWVLRRGSEAILVDTGFDPVVAERMGRTVLVKPYEVVAALGIDPSLIVITHLHYDHIGNVARFPDADLVIPRRELEFWTSPVARRAQFAAHVVPEEIAHVASRSPRLDGDVPGLQVTHVGGHSPGQTIVQAGDIVLASDALHYYEELERDRPPAVLHDLADCYAALDTLRGLNGVLVAGHDPLVTERFPSDDGVIYRIQGTT